MIGEILKDTLKNVLVFVFSAVIIIGIIALIIYLGKEYIKDAVLRAIGNIFSI